MPSLQFENLGWIEASFGPDEERATTASLRIVAGDLPSLEITKVEDRIAQSLRSHINVPLAPLALWLVMNWWRLRFEGKPDVPTNRWFQAHRLSSIGGDHAWPPLDIYSDKDFVRLGMDAEAAFDAAAIRYLQPVSLDVPADDFETAVDALLDHVDARLAATLCAYTGFASCGPSWRKSGGAIRTLVCADGRPWRVWIRAMHRSGGSPRRQRWWKKSALSRVMRSCAFCLASTDGSRRSDGWSTR